VINWLKNCLGHLNPSYTTPLNFKPLSTLYFPPRLLLYAYCYTTLYLLLYYSLPTAEMPSNYIFCTACKQYRSSTDFTTNRLGAPYKTCKSYKVILFLPLFTAFLTLYIGKKKGLVPMIFSGLSVA
jgi:hypothetical protein